jgi:DNA-directed RNA polymerase subunit E'/Rpb7
MRYASCLVFGLVLVGNVLAADREAIVDGKVKKVDGEKFEVTIERKNGKTTTVKIYRETEIRLDGKLTNWQAIKENQEVRAVFFLETKECTHFGIYEEINRPPLRN